MAPSNLKPSSLHHWHFSFVPCLWVTVPLFLNLLLSISRGVLWNLSFLHISLLTESQYDDMHCIKNSSFAWFDEVPGYISDRYRSSSGIPHRTISQISILFIKQKNRPPCVEQQWVRVSLQSQDFPLRRFLHCLRPIEHI